MDKLPPDAMDFLEESSFAAPTELEAVEEGLSAENEAAKTSAAPEPRAARMPDEKLAEILEQHRHWSESGGAFGARANLSGADLAGTDLTAAHLHCALLNKANLRGADLSLANLAGASLVQADLREANLLGADLRDADLEGAILEDAKGLWVGQLAGTQPFGTVLPEPLAGLDGPEVVGQATKTARRLIVAMWISHLIIWLVIGGTTDIRLLKNSPALPFSKLGDALPMAGFYLGVPLLLFCFFIAFHFFLLRLWGGLAALPAVFPDGRTLDKSGPWFVMGLVRSHFGWPRERRSSLSYLEKTSATLLAYWLAPATLLAFWGRYLTRQDLRGTMLHVALATAGVAAGASLPTIVARVVRAGTLQPERRKKTRGLFFVAGATLATGLLLSAISFGITRGVPEDSSRAPGIEATNIRRWAARALWLMGYSPYAELAENEISTKPQDWSGRTEDLAQVRGARLNQASLRYAQGYRTFLANARLWRADLQGAYLSEANLREADLEWAVLDRASLQRTILAEANLRGANLTRSDLREADLSYATLEDAILAQTRLEGASLYAAKLGRARLLRANLANADLREANLENATLALADLREADLGAAKLPGAQLRDAQLGYAMLIEADLRKADLRGVNFQEAVLRGASLENAVVDEADFRGARGITAAQICSSRSRRGAQLDPDLQLEVESRCGTAR